MIVKKKVAKALNWLATYTVPAGSKAVMGCPILFWRRSAEEGKRLTATDGRMLIDVELPAGDSSRDIRDPFIVSIGRSAWEQAATESKSNVGIVLEPATGEVKLDSLSGRSRIRNDVSLDRAVSVASIEKSFAEAPEGFYRTIYVDAERLRDMIQMVIGCIGRDIEPVPLELRIEIPAEHTHPIRIFTGAEPNKVRAALMPIIPRK